MSLAARLDLFQQILHEMLLRVGCDDVGPSAVPDDCVGEEADAALRGATIPGVPVAAAVTIGGERDGGIGYQVIEHDGDARIVNVQRQDHRRRLRTVVDQILSQHGFA